ncbi:MAG: hypothetical protein ACKVXR_07775 [Planctomycetota bacterium]
MRELPIVPGREAAKIQAAPAAAPGVQPGSPQPIAFEALLERLRTQARALEETAKEPLSARDLPGAVHVAQASLQDALTIAEGLVEAYRSSRIQAGP